MTVSPARTAPAGGEIYLPAISAPNSRLGRVWVKRKMCRILHRKIFRKRRKIRLKSTDSSRIWSECRDSNPRPLGPEGWSDIFHGHFRAFPRLSTRKISQRRPFRHGSFHLIFPRLGHGLGQDRKPAVQKLRRCKQRIGGDADRGWKGSFVIRLLCWSFAKAPDTAADTAVPPEYPAYCRAICRSCRVA